KKKPKPLQLQAFVIRNNDGDFLLEKNLDGRLLGGFWSFPIVETDFSGQQLDLFKKETASLKTVSQKALFEKDYQVTPD
ncbi:A/G-specific adenine glycosylase, partial [Enterococcus faecalis]|nr:A/G-specific adenine glycosylase [Enterococcus faecalis]